MRKLLAALLPALMLLSACQSRPARFEAVYADCFDTLTVLTLYAADQAAFDVYAAAIHDELTRLHRLFDIYQEYDGLVNLKTINDNAGGRPLAVDADIFALLTLGRAVYDQTEGAVNLALGAVTRLWHQSRAAGLEDPAQAAIPDRQALEAAAAHCNPDDIILDAAGQTVRLADPAMSLDVGAIAKGWAAGRAMTLAAELGVTSGVLNLGGNVIALGIPADGRAAWRVGIQNPDADQSGESLLGIVDVKGLALVSSGGYTRYYAVDGVRYHHILDPQTLMPAERYRAVTVATADWAMADVLSTALFVLPEAAGRRLAAQCGAEALWVLPDGAIVTTAGFPTLES